MPHYRPYILPRATAPNQPGAIVPNRPGAIAPNQPSLNMKNKKRRDDLWSRKDKEYYERRRAEKEAEERRERRRRRRRRCLYPLLCCLGCFLTALAGILIAYLVRFPTHNASGCNPVCMNNGTCGNNSVCQCASGYNGSYCQYPICNQTCVHGNCSAPDTCACNNGWNGSTCASPTCTPACEHGGTCVGPNTCNCTATGYNGSICQYPICSPSCEHNGICIAPNTCNCSTTGYNGSICQYPICDPSCLNGGICVAVNTCNCTYDVWTGNICQTPVQILWAFDNNLDDLYNNYQGVGNNGPSYGSPGITGYGTCLYLTAAYSQSVTVYTLPFLNMFEISFTIEAWIKANSFNNGLYTDNAMFGQFQSNTQDHSLYISIRNQKTYFGFYSDDISGSTTLFTGIWYHLAFVYDNSTLTQYIYVNGILDASGTSRGPYKGTSGDFTIGANVVNYPNNYWDGCIDQASFVDYAKNATEVLSDATLTLGYTFDDTNLDYGSLRINGTGTNATYSSSGRVNQCLALLNTPSFFTATGCVLLGITNQGYSLSIWIKPLATKNATIVHVAALPAGFGAWCIPMLGFSSGGAIVAESWNGTSVSVFGPIVTPNVWTHAAVTYSLSNGLRLWINGTLYSSSSALFSYAAANAPVIVTLGSSLGGTGLCVTSGIIAGQYYGYIDEFQLYSRELSAADIFNLANA